MGTWLLAAAGRDGSGSAGWVRGWWPAPRWDWSALTGLLLGAAFVPAVVAGAAGAGLGLLMQHSATRLGAWPS